MSVARARLGLFVAHVGLHRGFAVADQQATAQAQNLRQIATPPIMGWCLERRTRGPARQKPMIAVEPLAVSTESCFAVAGVPPRKLRAALAQNPDVPRARFGNTLVVTTADFRELLKRLDRGGSDESGDEAGENRAEGADDVLRPGRSHPRQRRAPMNWQDERWIKWFTRSTP